MSAFVFVQSSPVSAMLARVLPSVFERVPHSDLVIKALLMGIAVLVCTRLFSSSSGGTSNGSNFSSHGWTMPHPQGGQWMQGQGPAGGYN
jgi:hypothetical protein